jgi:5-methylcytosine-specific restriction endonuclease McrA
MEKKLCFCGCGQEVKKNNKFIFGHQNRGKNNYMYGKHHSEESKLKNSESNKGKQKGEKNPFYGKKHTENSREKISNKLKEYFTPYICAKKSNDMRGKNLGEKNSNWRGGITKEREKTTSSLKYKEWRLSVYTRDNYTCQACGSNKSGKLNAHHIEAFNNNPELRTQISNGITLCKGCHKNFHHQYGYGNNNKNQLNKFLEGK